MADEETPETTDQEPDAVTEEPPAEAAAGGEPEAVAEEPQAEAAAEPVDDTAGEEAAPAEPVEQVAPKERRRREKAAAASATGPRPSLSPQEREAARAEARAAKGAERRRRHASVRQRGQARTGSAVAQPAPAVEPSVPGQAKVRQGVVVSDKADKTITIRIDAARRHRRYKKIVRSTSTIHAHDERNEAHEGDTVRVIESRPLSRTKRWRLVEILERAK